MEIKKNTISIIISGNSGDGIQLMGDVFANTAVSMGNYISTFSDFPSEIRIPHDTIEGVSGFHITIGNFNILDYGELCDILIAMNAASLKKYLSKVKKGGIIIIDNYGFRSDNNPLDLYDYTLYKVNSYIYIYKLIKKYNLKIKPMYKNMYILGFLNWICNYTLYNTKKYLKKKFENEKLLNINIELLIHGFVLEKQNHSIVNRFLIKSTNKLKNKLKINGNQALALGLIMGCKKANIDIFYAGYPITPASNIFYYLSKYNIKIFQAEDEIAAITSAIGASYAGLLGITGTSGPGMSLKQEALGLASIIEIPLVIINIQRVGPSTGIPTKNEQSDLLQALYGRHGESPIPILASKYPNNCFKIAFEAVKIAIEYMTPVIILSDSYIANSYQLWNPIKEKKLKSIHKLQNNNLTQKNFYPYKRDKRGVRPWIIPGMTGYEHCIGSLEKEDLTGNLSSKGINHQKMVNLRHSKINNIINCIPIQKIEIGKNTGELLILSWGSTYNIIYLAMMKLLQYSVSYTHLEYIYPLPNGLKNILLGFKFILIPELNNGQLIKLIRYQFLIDAIPFNKIQCLPFTVSEIVEKVKSILQ
ncbi:MAG: 2-oxoacid:acceptor oxidoreductase subunit alpha [Candidatus Bostrichicola ureolyticus]|nr:MAG: 2-oxoacid:acceptor oxidoreductase subunit alpha [Candidatus Bostrichicola ureolyticus]